MTTTSVKPCRFSHKLKICWEKKCRGAVCHFLALLPCRRRAASTVQAAVFIDTLHVENIHHPKFLHIRCICPLSHLEQQTKNRKNNSNTNTQMTDQMVLGSESQKITYFSASLLHPRSSPSPLLTCMERSARGFHSSPCLCLATSTLIILSEHGKASDAFIPTTTPAVFSH